MESPHELLAVVTTPDRPKGRGLRLQPNPVKEHCGRPGLSTYTPSSLRNPELEEKINSLEPDLFVVASYGKLIPDSWLRIPRKLALNLHPSLLPKYRGAAPIPWQILNGETETGITIAEVTRNLDAGDIFCQIRATLQPHETAEDLTRRLAELARTALMETLAKVEKGRLERIPQKESESSYARKLNKEDGDLNLMEPASQLERKIRAFYPWPGAFIGYQKKPLRIVQGLCDSVACAEAKPATLLEVNAEGFLRIQTGQGSLKIFKVQLPGRQVISGRDFANGQRLKAGFVFESLP